MALLPIMIMFASLGTPAPAHARDGQDGFCTDDRGVSVVIDFGAVGGDPRERCAPDFTSGTGLQALRQAGVEVEGVAGTGEGFVCRFDGRPAATEDLSASGIPQYRERCLDIPPVGAHWSYWYAEEGGEWTESALGVKNRQAVPGGFEGWSYTMGTDGNTPPRIPPERASAQASEPTTLSPTGGAADPDQSATTRPSPTTSSSTPTTGTPTAGTPTTGTPTTGLQTPVPPTPRSSIDESGPPPGTVQGLVALGVLAMVGLGVAGWRRLRH